MTTFAMASRVGRRALKDAVQAVGADSKWRYTVGLGRGGAGGMYGSSAAGAGNKRRNSLIFSAAGFATPWFSAGAAASLNRPTRSSRTAFPTRLEMRPRK